MSWGSKRSNVGDPVEPTPSKDPLPAGARFFDAWMMAVTFVLLLWGASVLVPARSAPWWLIRDWSCGVWIYVPWLICGILWCCLERPWRPVPFLCGAALFSCGATFVSGGLCALLVVLGLGMQVHFASNLDKNKATDVRGGGWVSAFAAIISVVLANLLVIWGGGFGAAPAPVPPGPVPDDVHWQSQSSSAVTDWADVLQREPDPEVVTEAKARSEIVASGMPWRVRERRSGIVLLLVPAGTFLMGSPPSEESRGQGELIHPRRIRRPFYLGESEVSQAEWLRLRPKNPSKHVGDEFPVERVSCAEAKAFARDCGLRLPSEAEWEYACRAGSALAFGFGASLDWHLANFDGTAVRDGLPPGQKRGETIEVGQLGRNAWGFADMHGNVGEWCEDTLIDYPSEGADERPMQGGKVRVIRGGTFLGSQEQCRSACRQSVTDDRYLDVGLRLARAAR